MRFDALRRLLERMQVAGRGSLESAQESAAFTDSELAFGRLVLPLLEDHASMKRLVESLTRHLRVLEEVLDRLPVAALTLDSDGTLLTLNRAARELFGGPAVTTQILRASRRALADRNAGEEAFTVPFPGPDGPPLRLAAADVGDTGSGPADEPGEEGASPGVVFVLSLASPPAVDTAALTARFALTRTEAAVVANVAQGGTNREIAERLDMSVSTVRTHLASAFRRTGARNRAAIVALAFGAPFGQGPIVPGEPDAGEA